MASDVQGVINDALKVLKQHITIHTCIDAIGNLRRTLASPDVVIRRKSAEWLSTATPTGEELIALWDAHSKTQDSTVAVHLMMTLSHILYIVSETSIASQSLQSTAATIAAQMLLRHRLKAFYHHLSSQDRTRASAALTLLSQIVRCNSASAAELLRAFDFDLAALKALARPPKKPIADRGRELHRINWCWDVLDDAVKRPTRAAFISFALALLETLDNTALPELLRVRPLVGGALQHLASDPPEAQVCFLKAINKRMFGKSSRAPGMASGNVLDVFSDAVLGQLALISASDVHLDDNEDQSANVRALEAHTKAATLAHSVLLRLCTEPARGLCASVESVSHFRLIHASAPLKAGPRRIMRLLQRLKPTESGRHGELLRAAIGHDGAVAAALLLATVKPAEPSASAKWMAHAGILSSLLERMKTVPSGFRDVAERGEVLQSDPVDGFKFELQAVVRSTFPAALPRAALSRGIQHPNALVRFASLCLVSHVLGIVEALLQDVRGAAEIDTNRSSISENSTGTSTSEHGVHLWLELGEYIRSQARAALPGVQTIVAQLTAAEKRRKENDQGNDKGSKEAATLGGAALHALRLWRRCMPSALREGNVDVGKLVPDDLHALHPLYQLQYLSLLEAEDEDLSVRLDGSGLPRSPHSNTSPGPAMLPVLRLLTWLERGVGDSQEYDIETVKRAAVRGAAVRWLSRRLVASGLFESDASEAVVWMGGLQPGAGRNVEDTGESMDALSSFVFEAVSTVIRRPEDVFDLLQAAVISVKGNSQKDQYRPSLIAICALRQACKVLSSTKRSSESKSAITSYVASTLTMVVLRQTSPRATSALISTFLGVLRMEAEKMVPEDAKNLRKRKSSEESIDSLLDAAFGVAGGPLRTLAVWMKATSTQILEQDATKQFSVGCVREEKSASSKKKKRRENNDALLENILPDVAPWDLFPGVKKIQTTAVELPSWIPITMLPLACAYIWERSADLGGPSSKEELIRSLAAEVETRFLRAKLFHDELESTYVEITRQALHLLRIATFHEPACALLRAIVAGCGDQAMLRSDRQCVWSVLRECCSSEYLIAWGLAPVETNKQGLDETTSFTAATLQWALDLACRLRDDIDNDRSGQQQSKEVEEYCDTSTWPAVGRIVQVVASKTENGYCSKGAPTVSERRLFASVSQLASGQDLKIVEETLVTVLEWIEANATHTEQQQAGVDDWVATVSLAASSLLKRRPALASDAILLLVTRLCQAAQRLLAGGASSHYYGSVCALLMPVLLHERWTRQAMDALGHSDAVFLFTRLLTMSHSTGLVLMENTVVPKLAAALVNFLPKDLLLNEDTMMTPLLEAIQPSSNVPPVYQVATICRPMAIYYRRTTSTSNADGVSAVKAALGCAVCNAIFAWMDSDGLFVDSEGPSAQLETAIMEELGEWVTPCFASSITAWGPSSTQLAEALHRVVAAVKRGRLAFLSQDSDVLAVLLKYTMKQRPDVRYDATDGGSRSSLYVHRSHAKSYASAVTAVVGMLSRCVKAHRENPALHEVEIHALTSVLNGPLNDAVAALPSTQRSTSDFWLIADAILNDLADVGLQGCGMEDAAILRVLRRSAAAVLPGEDESSSTGIAQESFHSGETMQAVKTTRRVASAAAELFMKIINHANFFQAMQAADASPPPLPLAASLVPRPLTSIMPFAEIFTSTVEKGIKNGVQGLSPISEVKKEICQLLETLLDVEETFAQFYELDSRICSPPSYQDDLEAAEIALLPLTMASYGGSLSTVDVAIWGLARALNTRIWRRRRDTYTSGGVLEKNDHPEAEVLEALLNGPLATTSMAWGGAAVAVVGLGSEEPSPAHRFEVIRSKLPIDPVRCAATVVNFPEHASVFMDVPLGGEGNSEEVLLEGSTSTPTPTDGLVAGPSWLSTCQYGFDPVFIVPFTVLALRSHLLSPRSVVALGLASLCIRALAAEDYGLRSLAFEALALLLQQLERVEPRQKYEDGKNESFGDFRERSQILAVLRWVRDALTSPFPRVPTVHTVFAAEALLVSCTPEALMYGPINKFRLRTPTLDLTTVPLFRRIILAGSPDASAERVWLLRMLLAGLRSAKDANLYRRYYVFELAMSLVDASITPKDVQRLAAALVLRAVAVPAAARHLCEHTGLIAWLADRVVMEIRGKRGKTMSLPGNHGVLGGALKALVALQNLRSVVGRPPRFNARVVEDLSLACKRIVSCVMPHTRATGGTAASAECTAHQWKDLLQVCVFAAEASSSRQLPVVPLFTSDEARRIVAAAHHSMHMEGRRLKKPAGGIETIIVLGDRLVRACSEE